ncbi:MAG: protein kinase [Proteobacteria bacterium]|nr:protein kinase [Pseudomonadota bacterium]
MSESKSEVLGRTVLGRYRIVKRLARGGMGVVYLARTEGAAGFAKPVVVKRILEDLTGDENMARMFIREARIMANLEHPGIVSVLDFGHEDGAYMMVLEYVPGYHLGQWLYYNRLKRHRVPVDWSLHIVAQILDALHYAHTFTQPDGKPTPIVHRDISPSNILLSTDGRVKLLDFGIARMLGEANEFKTQDGRFKGKLAYTAPEAFGGAEPEPASDVYSAGVLLYELISGKNPFRGREMRETFQRVMNYQPPSIHALRDDAPEAIDEVVSRALQKTPRKRFESAHSFSQRLIALRSKPADEIAARLAERTREDFHGDMPQALGLEPLEVRDRAWRGIAQQADGPRDQAELALEEEEDTDSLPDEEQVQDLRETSDVQRPATARGAATWKFLLAGLALVGVVGAFVVSRNRHDPQAIYVVQQPHAEQPAARPAEPSQATAGSPARPPAPPLEPRRAPTASPEIAQAPGATPSKKLAVKTKPKRAKRRNRGPNDPDLRTLSRAFRKRQTAVEQCFQRHAQTLSGRPQVRVQFQVDSRGRVTRSELEPSALNETPLGRCLLLVSRGTHFGPQPQAISFSIPITARRLR